MKVVAQDDTTYTSTTFVIHTADNPNPDQGSTGTYNGGASEGTNFTASITVEGEEFGPIQSNDFPTDTITFTLPHTAAHEEGTIRFWLQPGASLVDTLGATIIESPTNVTLGASPSTTKYYITVIDDREDEHAYTIKVVIEDACVGTCGATTLLSLSLPLAILLFLFGRTAAQQ
jgi:hypothetical protein